MHFYTDKICSPGGRTYNEDFVAFVSQGNCRCWVLADGLGGHGGGDIASRVAVDAVIASFRENKELCFKNLNDHFLAAQRAVLAVQQQDSRLQMMRTTLVVLLADDHQVMWGHIGDSRLYFLKQGVIHKQTEDHSVPQALAFAHEIEFNEIRSHPDRNRLLQSIGNAERLKPTLERHPIMIKEGDAFLLCSDGFWEYVLEIEIEIDYCKSASPGDWLGKMEERLQTRIQPNEENDNYSAIGVYVEKN